MTGTETTKGCCSLACPLSTSTSPYPGASSPTSNESFSHSHHSPVKECLPVTPRFWSTTEFLCSTRRSGMRTMGSPTAHAIFRSTGSTCTNPVSQIESLLGSPRDSETSSCKDLRYPPSFRLQDNLGRLRLESSSSSSLRPQLLSIQACSLASLNLRHTSNLPSTNNNLRSTSSSLHNTNSSLHNSNRSRVSRNISSQVNLISSLRKATSSRASRFHSSNRCRWTNPRVLHHQNNNFNNLRALSQAENSQSSALQYLL